MAYDAAGNLLQDGTGTGTHTYQWVAKGFVSSRHGGGDSPRRDAEGRSGN